MILTMRQLIRGTALVLGCTAMMAGAQLAIEPIIREPGEPVKPPVPSVPTPRTTRFAEGPQGDILEFRDRARLQGSLVSMDAAEGDLVWEHPAAMEPIVFEPQELHRVTLGRRLTPRRVDDAMAIRLTNGDQLFGRLTAMGTDTVTIDTWYAGRLDIDRSMVSRIAKHHALTGLVYDGPDAVSQWRTGGENPDWRLKDGALASRSNTPLGRIFEDLPDPAIITFDLAWENALNVLITLYTDDVSRHDAGGYAVHLFSSHTRLLSFDQERELSDEHLSMTPLAGAGPQDSRMRAALWLNRGAGEITLVINGVQQAAWSGLDFEGLDGKGIVFEPQMEGEFRLSALRIREWDGVAPPLRPDAAAKADTDLLVFANNDQVSGRVNTLREGMLQIETSFATTSVPLAEVMEITFSSVDRRTAAPEEGCVVAEFAGEGEVTLVQVKIAAGELRGTSAAFGPLVAPLNAFRSLRFHDRDPAPEPEPAAEEDPSLPPRTALPPGLNI